MPPRFAPSSPTWRPWTGDGTDDSLRAQAPVGPRAARAVRRADPPRPHHPRHPHRIVADRARADRHRPFRFAGGSGASGFVSNAHPITGGSARVSRRDCLRSRFDAVRALNRTRRGDIDVLARVLDVHYPEQVEPTTLHGGAALYGSRRAAIRFWSRTTRISAVRRALPAGLRDAAGTATASRASSTTDLAPRLAGRRARRRRHRSRRRSTARAPSPPWSRPAIATATPTANATTRVVPSG